MKKLALGLVLLSSAALAQPAAPLAFEVASVKAAGTPAREPMICIVPCSPGERLTVEGSRVDIRFMSLQKLILTAWRIKAYQLTGPDWIKSAHFDIAAKMPAGAHRDRLPEMLQALLAERFKLTLHRDTRELPVYALVVGKGGPRLQPATEPEASGPLPEPPGSTVLYTPQGEARELAGGGFISTGGAFGPMRGGRGASGGMKMEFLNVTMAGLADVLSPHLDRPVVDQTGLKGGYYFASENRPLDSDGGGGRKGGGPPEGGRAGGDAPMNGRPNDLFGEALFSALDKAGLKLEKTKAPAEILVVDHLEKTPTEN